MRFLFWGASAIGGTMGRCLARADHGLTFVASVGEHVRAIDRAGIRITGPITTFTSWTPAFAPNAVSGTWNTIVLATKAHHTGAALHAVLPHLAVQVPLPCGAALFILYEATQLAAPQQTRFHTVPRRSASFVTEPVRGLLQSSCPSS